MEKNSGVMVLRRPKGNVRSRDRAGRGKEGNGNRRLPSEFIMGAGSSDEVETQEQEDEDDEQDDFGSQLSLNSPTHENGAPTNKETGSSDRFDVVRTKNKTIDGSQQ